MRLRPDQLARQLATLAPVYLISGDEALIVQECADQVRAACRKQGFTERQVFHVEAGFDWERLVAEASALSLFAERRLIELRMPTGKPGDAGSKAIERYCQHAGDDTVLMILCGKLDGSSTRSKWYKAVDGRGVTVPVWPVDAAQLPRWIEQRMRQAGLRATPEAIQLLADRVQGNLLAAAQEIEKLRLYSVDGSVNAETVAEMVGDSARFDIFGVAERALAGDAGATLRALAGLRQEGTEAQLVLWSLSKEVRTLCSCAEQIAQGHGIDRVLDGAGVWDRRKGPVRAALQRLPLPELRQLLQLCQQIDVATKGGSADDPWQLLDQLALRLAGVR
ncbi:MAG: DNA polymerase III subunit delta [Spongiibacteraceae bacterium]|jgi:DNA polymerase-3 subunit delta|nr:DNA polymerase III subunit delta [Spongiibacteraceae bacterium]